LGGVSHPFLISEGGEKKEKKKQYGNPKSKYIKNQANSEMYGVERHQLAKSKPGLKTPPHPVLRLAV
jgi:hypothetical protein